MKINGFLNNLKIFSDRFQPAQRIHLHFISGTAATSFLTIVSRSFSLSLFTALSVSIFIQASPFNCSRPLDNLMKIMFLKIFTLIFNPQFYLSEQSNTPQNSLL